MWTNCVHITSREDVLCVNSLGVCRLCMLKGCTSMESIFRSSLPSSIADKIASVTRLALTEGDGLPTMVCQQCLFQLDIADTFIRRCEQSDRSFRCMSIQGEQESATSRNETLAQNCLETSAAVDNALGAVGSDGQYVAAAIEQDQGDQAFLSIEYPIKIEFTDDTLNYEGQAFGEFTAENYESQGNRFDENEDEGNISIKIEEVRSVEIADTWTEKLCGGVLSCFETDLGSQLNKGQVLSVVEENHKCAKCSLSFATWRSLRSHYISHIRQQKKTKQSSRLKGLRKKHRERSTKKLVVPGELQEKDNVNILTYSEMQDIDESHINLNNNKGQSEDIPPPLQKNLVAQSLENGIECALRPADFSPHKSQAAHNKFHKTKSKNKRIFPRKASPAKQNAITVSVSNQCAQNNTSTSIQPTESNAKDDHLVDKFTDHFTTNEVESSQQPNRNKILYVTKWYKCSICLCKFSTKLKQTLHICPGKTGREKISQQRLRNRTCIKIASEPLKLTGLGDDETSDFKEIDVSNNKSNNTTEQLEVISTQALSTRANEIPSTDLQEHNSEKLSSATINLGEAAEKEAQSMVEAKQSKIFKCDACLLEFCFSFQLKRHLREAKCHSKKKPKHYHPVESGENKSAQVPQAFEFKKPIAQNLPLADKAYDADVVAKPYDLNSNNGLFLEETLKNAADKIFTLQPAVSMNHDLSSFPDNGKAVSQDEISPSVVDFKCDLCNSKFLCSSSHTQHICHTKDHNSKKVPDVLPCIRGKITKESIQLLPTKTHLDGVSHIFKTNARRSDVLATSKNQKMTTAQECGDLSGESSLSIKLLSEPINNNVGKDSPKHLMNHEPIKHESHSETAQKGHSQIPHESNKQTASGKESKLEQDSLVLKKRQKVKPTTNTLEDNKVLSSEERFFGRKDPLKLQSSNEIHRNVLNRKLVVQLDRLIVSADRERNGVTDFTQQTQSKSSSPTAENISVRNNTNEKSETDLEVVEHTLPVIPSEFDEEIKIKVEKSHTKARGFQKKRKKYTCKFCYMEYFHHLALARHMKIHKKGLLKKGFLAKARDDELPSSQDLVSPKNDDAPVSKVQRDVKSDCQQRNATPDSSPKDEPCKMKLTCFVCLAQFLTEFDLATHAKLHKKSESHTPALKSPSNPLPGSVEESRNSSRTLRKSCDGCMRTFATWDTLKTHKRMRSCGSKTLPVPLMP